MARKLKVYRTPIGFHDAYVAAPSQKAALEAWGTDANLFARGVAEVVTDDDLVREPLANPGAVIKRLRGSEAEQLAALPPDLRKTPKRAAVSERIKQADEPRRVKKAAQPQPKPRPSRAALDQAETKLSKLTERQDAEERDLREREKAIARERRDLERRHERDRATAEKAVDRERQAHSEALAKWIEDQQ